MKDMDADHDGHRDIVMYGDDAGTATGWVSILYGNRNGGLPDTNEFQTISSVRVGRASSSISVAIQ